MFNGIKSAFLFIAKKITRKPLAGKHEVAGLFI
jgi:hypothetical protein